MSLNPENTYPYPQPGMGGVGSMYYPYNTFHSFDAHLQRSAPYPYFSMGSYHPHIHHPNGGSMPPASPPHGAPLHHPIGRTYSNASVRSGGNAGGGGGGGGAVPGVGYVEKDGDIGSVGSGERTPRDWHSQ